MEPVRDRVRNFRTFNVIDERNGEGLRIEYARPIP
jgi:hypothetical protein